MRMIFLVCLVIFFTSLGFAEKKEVRRSPKPTPTATPAPAKFDKAVWG